MSEWADRRRAFGSVAELYDRARPGYPDALVDEVLEFAALDGRPVLDRSRWSCRGSRTTGRRGASGC
jgi:hypothetical protein